MREGGLGTSAWERDRASSVRRHVGEGLSRREASERLDVASPRAPTPQAKGRVDRANQTLRDRLVEELRLMEISSVDAADAVLPRFVAAWNETFAGEPREDADARRPWDDMPGALDDRKPRRSGPAA